jgi:uncharacterized protein (DUF2062 family)
MPRKHFRRFLPSAHSVKEHRVLRLLGPVLHHPNLWHLNRHSVAGGVAVGALTGLIPGPFQILSAAICAVIFRVNLPVAVFTTFYTNPLTFFPLYFVAYKIGAFITGEGNSMPHLALEFRTNGFSGWIPAFVDWLAALGKPLLVGVPILGSVLAVSGYFLVQGLWRLYIAVQWRKRQKRRMKAPR